MLSMSTVSLRELREQLGTLVRSVATTGEEVVVTDSGTEVAVIISLTDYERLHEHADVADALRLQAIRSTPYTRLTLSEMLEQLGLEAEAIGSGS
jgi:prevent-host-death family protein